MAEQTKDDKKRQPRQKQSRQPRRGVQVVNG
jgi:hypothetical protein